MEDKTEELKSCAFCGSDDVAHYPDKLNKEMICCHSCGSSSGAYDTEKEALDCWNTRANNLVALDEESVRLFLIPEIAKLVTEWNLRPKSGKGSDTSDLLFCLSRAICSKFGVPKVELDVVKLASFFRTIHTTSATNDTYEYQIAKAITKAYEEGKICK